MKCMSVVQMPPIFSFLHIEGCLNLEQHYAARMERFQVAKPIYASFKMNNLGISVRGSLKDRILEKWNLMGPRYAIRYCIILMVGSWIAFWSGFNAYYIDVRMTMLLFVLGGFLLMMSEILYRKYQSGMSKRRIMG